MAGGFPFSVCCWNTHVQEKVNPEISVYGRMPEGNLPAPEGFNLSIWKTLTDDVKREIIKSQSIGVKKHQQSSQASAAQHTHTELGQHSRTRAEQGKDTSAQNATHSHVHSHEGKDACARCSSDCTCPADRGEKRGEKRKLASAQVTTTQTKKSKKQPKNHSKSKKSSATTAKRNKNEPEERKCGDCDYKCKRKITLDVHRASKHGAGNLKVLFCDEEKCDYRTFNRNNLYSHKYSVHAIKKCNTCGYQSKSTAKVKLHKTIKHGAALLPLLSCFTDKCNFSTYDKEKMKEHAKNVHRLKNLTCQLCDYVAKRKSKLRDHMANKHDIGVKWHHCTMCSYKCKLKSNLKIHMLYKHTSDKDIKWFECHMHNCSKKFKQRQNLNDHLARVHGWAQEWNFTCEKCGKHFHQSYWLKEHMRKEHSIASTLFQCALCKEVVVTDMKNLKSHLAKVHKVSGSMKELSKFAVNKVAPT